MKQDKQTNQSSVHISSFQGNGTAAICVCLRDWPVCLAVRLHVPRMARNVKGEWVCTGDDRCKACILQLLDWNWRIKISFHELSFQTFVDTDFKEDLLSSFPKAM